MKEELKIFFTALRFYTRIPCPKWVEHSQRYLNESTRYFPFMGWIVGASAASIFYVSHLILPVSVSILLSMITSVLMTGAFHEDGFADACDGFGGGWTKQEILEIMKDSRIGAFGTVGLFFILFFKFFLLLETHVLYIPFVIFAAHTISRFAASVFKYTHCYVGQDMTSSAKPMAEGMSLQNLLIAAVFGIFPLFLFWHWYGLLLIAPVLLTEQLISRYFVKRIGGFTGDCLGATQQLCEVVFYLSSLIVWRFI